MTPPTTETRPTTEDIFQAVCDLPIDQRAARLDELCAGNAESRREVEDLLRHHDADSGFLETPAVEDAFQEIVKTGKRDEEPRQPMIGRQIGNYRILALLGRGGMGEVYLARDAELGVDVVIKLLREEFKDDPEWMARFNREGRLNAELNHPNIAGIRYKGEVDGRQFLVFEFVAGETLEARLKKGALPVKDALPLFSQLADALSFAHSKGIIHRDLKPANLMLTPDGQLKVLDFGIAKKITADLTTIEILLPEDELTTDFGKTRRGEVMGTVVYMSPEQTRGEPLDHRTDLWSFGCVLYETLSGKRPFGGVDVYDTLNVIRTTEPDWDALPTETPDAIRTLLQRCLRKKPAQRLASANEAQATIEQLISPSLRMSLRRKVFIAVALLALLMASGFGGAWLRSWWIRSAIPANKQLVVLPFKGFSNDQAGVGFADDLRRNLLRVSDAWQAVPANDLRTTNLLNLDLQNISRKLGANLIVSGEVQQVDAQLKIRFRVQNSFLYTLAEEEISGLSHQLAMLQTQIAERVADKLKLTKSARATAYSQQLQINHSQATEQYLVAIGELQKDLNRESVEKPITILTRLVESEGDSARLQSALARAYLNKYTFTNLAEWLEKALQAATQAVALAPDQPYIYQITRGLVYLELANPEEALKDFTAALARSPRDWEGLKGLAQAYVMLNNFEQAEKVYLRLIQMWPNYWDGYNDLGHFYFQQGKYDKAIECWRKVADLLPDSHVGYNNLATAYLQTDQEEKAIQTYLISISKDATRDNFEAYTNLGVVYFEKQQYNDAASYFQKGLDLAKEGGRLDAGLFGNLADAYRQLGRIEALPGKADEYNRLAAEAYDNAINLSLQEIGAGTAEPLTLALLAEWLAKRGKTTDAIKYIKQVQTADAQSLDIPYRATLIYWLAGNANQSMYWLEKLACGGYGIARLNRDPELQDLRLNPRYDSVITKCQSTNR